MSRHPSIEAEEKLVSLLFTYPEEVRGVWTLDEGCFLDRRNYELFAAVKRLVDAKAPVMDATVIKAELGSGYDFSYLMGIYDIESDRRGLETYAEIMRENRVRGKLKILAAKMGKYKGDDLNEQVSATRAFLDGLARDVSKGVRTIGEVVEQKWPETEEDIRHDKGRLRTGLEDLDKQFISLREGTLTVVGGETSYGKTALVMSVAQNLLRTGLPVLYIALEMSEGALMRRLLYPLAGINVYDLPQARSSSEGLTAVVNRAKKAGEELSRYPLAFWVEPDLSIDLIRGQARVEIGKRGVKLVIVDYIQLLHGTKGEGMDREFASIIGGLKALADKENVAVLAVSQFNSGDPGQTGAPTMARLFGSRTLAQVPDNVLMLHKDEGMFKELTPDGEIAWEEIQLKISKQRDGRKNKMVKLRFYPARTLFTDWRG